MPRNDGYWFPAKRYGWGWGPPNNWQGWSVLAGFVALVAVGGAMNLPQSPAHFIACVVVLSLLLIAVCWWKGEPPRWRWGGD